MIELSTDNLLRWTMVLSISVNGQKTVIEKDEELKYGKTEASTQATGNKTKQVEKVD